MEKGDHFLVGDRLFVFDKFEYDWNGVAQSYIARCLEPREEDTGEWWAFNIRDFRTLPAKVTLQ